MRVRLRRERPAPAGVDPTYRAILVPVVAGVSEDIVSTAGRLAASEGAVIGAITVLEVPVQLPLDEPLPDEEAAAGELLDRVRAIAESFGARVVTYVVRARSAGKAIVEEAARTHAEVIMLGVPAKRRIGPKPFGPTVDYVLANSPCRMVLAAEPAHRRNASTERSPGQAT